MSSTNPRVVSYILKHRLLIASTITLLTVLVAAHFYSVDSAARTVVVAQGADDIHTESEFVNRVSIVANDVVYNPTDQLLYVSVPASVGIGGNTIVSINPATGEVGSPVFVGSDPNKLAMSDDGHSLYVFLEGAYAVRRF